MLKLENITKDYSTGSEIVRALRGVSLEFRQNEFVSILGPSGCGKTTMLNIVGGLDRYTSGDLIIGGKSTKDFCDREWDAYRNNVVGMVFQSYNLISHLSILENVSIALTLSGVSISERKERAIQALIDVGLEDKIYKKPNELSGGQMQRVAIARALVNNPDILLADEPTGALDSKTSIQVMEILKKISKDRLVILVTHNEQLAAKYSDRIVRLVDGKILEDSKHYESENKCREGKLINKKTSMSFWTAIRHSFKNLKTKKGRTILTSIAGSIGILGIALVLAISNGINLYTTDLQRNTMAGYPITIMPTVNTDSDIWDFSFNNSDREGRFPEEEKIFLNTRSLDNDLHINDIGDEYLSHVDKMNKSWYNTLTFTYGLQMQVIVKSDTNSYKKTGMRSTGKSSMRFSELPEKIEFMDSQYDILECLEDTKDESGFPTAINEAALVVDSYNRVRTGVLSELGVDVQKEYEFSDFLGREFRVIPNNLYYEENDGIFSERTDYKNMYEDENAISVKIVSILRVKPSAANELLSSSTVVYTKELTDFMIENANESDIALAQKEAGDTINVFTGKPFNPLVANYTAVMLAIGADTSPIAMQIYPTNFANKEKIKEYLNEYNLDKSDDERILYTDLAETIAGATSKLINTITIALSAFAGVSLVVSSIMIGIITYVSVVERTKEIGILRAIGARKRDISRLFNAETIIVGFLAGVIGILVALILSIPLNSMIYGYAGIAGIVKLEFLAAIGLIGLSVGLTLIAGFLPSRWAAKKDPVRSLRTE